MATTLHERIMELDGIESSPMKHYIGYKYQKKVVADIEMQHSNSKSA